MNVKDRAVAVGTFRHVNVFLMETLAKWIPSTPEMEVKVMMGRHLWLVAQAADRLGRRARELRAPVNYSHPPAAAFAAALDQLAGLRETGSRIDAFHGAVLDALAGAYATYVTNTDRVIDEPSVVILEDALRDVERMRSERAKLLEEFPGLREAPSAAAVRQAFSVASGLIAASEPARQSA